MTNQTESSLNKYDKAGIIFSGACAIHCLLLPVLAFSSPFISSFLENEWIHRGLLFLLTPVALIAFSSGYKTHQKFIIPVLGVVGVLVLISTAAAELFGHMEPFLEKGMTAVGSLILIAAHVLNSSYLKKSS